MIMSPCKVMRKGKKHFVILNTVASVSVDLNSAYCAILRDIDSDPLLASADAENSIFAADMRPIPANLVHAKTIKIAIMANACKR